MFTAEMRDRNDQIGIKAGLENAIETSRSVFLGGPFRVGEKREVIKRIDESCFLGPHRAKKIVRMNDVGISQTRLEIVWRKFPEIFRVVEGLRDGQGLKVGTGNFACFRFPPGVPIYIPESRIKKILIIRIQFRQTLDQSVGKIAASGF